MLRIIGLVLTAGLLLVACGRPDPGEPGRGERLERRVSVDGLERRYVVHLPPAAEQGGRAWPVIFGFHGGWGTAETFEDQSELHNARQGDEFVIVYPDGYQRSWNTGPCCGRASAEGIDDVRFVQTMLEDLNSLVTIDDRRIYATGFSNGAMMAYHLACVMADRIAAIAPASAAMQGSLERCEPTRPVPVLHFHGRQDEWSPFVGGMSKREQIGEQLPIPEMIDYWAELNQCRTEEPVTLARNTDCTAHRGCRADAEVVLCVVEDMGHQWAGDDPRMMMRVMLGPPAREVEASDVVLDFFKKHPLPRTTADATFSPRS